MCTLYADCMLSVYITQRIFMPLKFNNVCKMIPNETHTNAFIRAAIYAYTIYMYI